MKDETVRRLHAIPAEPTTDGVCPVCRGNQEAIVWSPGGRCPQIIDTTWLCPLCVWGLRIPDIPMRIDHRRTESA